MSDLDNGTRGGRMFALSLRYTATEAQIMRRVHRLANFYRDKGHLYWATGFVGGAATTLNGTYRTYTNAERNRL